MKFRSSTYNAQCTTWNIAKEMFGLSQVHKIDIAAELEAAKGNGEPDPLMSFRARPGYRSPGALKLRQMVAIEARRRRSTWSS